MNPRSEMPRPVPYSDQVEQLSADEQDSIRELVDTLLSISRTVYRDSGHAERGVHAKSHALLEGELKIIEPLPEILRQGLFSETARYPVVLRLSTIPGDVLADSVSVPRGLAIKVGGVQGERLPGSESDRTQDFVLVNAPAFSAPDAKTFLKSLKLLAATTDRAETGKKVLSAALRGAETLVEAAGGESATLKTMGGQPQTHPLADAYYSQAPLRYGQYMVKLAAVPTAQAMTRLEGETLKLLGAPDGLRHALRDYFAEHGAEWELRVQLCTNLESMPIEDASVIWPEDESPYITVGRITVPSQASWSEARSTAVDDRMAFSPWHGLAAHRPLGSVMRVRKDTYEASARFRGERNACPIVEPQQLPSLAE